MAASCARRKSGFGGEPKTETAGGDVAACPERTPRHPLHRRILTVAKKVKIGIVGCGGIAKGKHLPALAKLPNVELVAFCDIINERAVECAEKWGTKDAKVYTKYKDMLK